MIVNCVAYQDGRKIADIPKEAISDYVSRTDCFVWVALKNPDPAELVRGRSARTIAALTAMLGILKGLPLGYQRDLQEDKPPLFCAVAAYEGSLGVLAGLISTLSVFRSWETFRTTTTIERFTSAEGRQRTVLNKCRRAELFGAVVLTDLTNHVYQHERLKGGEHIGSYRASSGLVVDALVQPQGIHKPDGSPAGRTGGLVWILRA